MTNQVAHVVTFPVELNDNTQRLLLDFVQELAAKLTKAQRKHGYSDHWKDPAVRDELHLSFAEHIAKGDPRDVAAYCAFKWWHGWSTYDPEMHPREPKETTKL